MFVVFCYAFPHQKTADGLIKCLLEGVIPDLVIAAPYKILPRSTSSSIRIQPQFIAHPLAADVCRKFNIEYFEEDHNSPIVASLLASLKPDIGLILGSRILRAEVVSAFSKGIINAHPGLLPHNRGLDNIKWAVLDEIPQAVTFHLIDEKIDVGRKIKSMVVPVFEGDNWYDLYLRNINVQISHLINIIEFVRSEPIHLEYLSSGKYNRAMDVNEENQAVRALPAYISNYEALSDNFEIS